MTEEIAIDDRHYYKQSGEWRLKAHTDGAYDTYTNECCSPLLDEIERLRAELRLRTAERDHHLKWSRTYELELRELRDQIKNSN